MQLRTPIAGRAFAAHPRPSATCHRAWAGADEDYSRSSRQTSGTSAECSYVDGPKAASLFVFGLALRDPTPLLRESVGGTGSGRSSVVAEPAWWVNCLEFTELDIADRLQRIGQRTILQVGRQRVQPFGILSLQRSQLADGVRPTPGAAAMVGRATH